MPAGKSRRGAPAAAPGSGGDRIGALPDEILHRVLSFLPAQQAVQTCVLARRWLDLWKSATGLRIVGADGKEPAPFGEVREFVDSLLLLRGRSPLETFEIRVAGDVVDVRHLRLWVRYGTMCNAQVLRLKVHGEAPAFLRLEDPALASRHLTKIVLRGLVFNNDFLDFSRCPVLQDLKIKDSSFMHAERISSLSLKRLNITGMFNESSRTRIHTPNLASLELVVTGGRIPKIESMPLLVSAGVEIAETCDCCRRSNNGDCDDENCIGCILKDTSSVFLHGISQAKSLELGAGAEVFIFRRDLKWCPIFSRLKTLKLTEHYVHALSCILKHSPVLESLKLYLLVFNKGFKGNVKMSGRFNPTELPSTISPHLKSVKVRCATVDRRVLKVLEFLSKLNISPCTASTAWLLLSSDPRACATTGVAPSSQRDIILGNMTYRRVRYMCWNRCNVGCSLVKFQFQWEEAESRRQNFYHLILFKN
ncbi:F-box/LRR-repeat protein At4g14103-like isoform X3 [Panicum virgatum]|uniref:F-box domain-containing protein n=1 Tax=Panicum virgatum TaxID=38727 RepID=A0A8T0P6T6_PANVG|nr:F-box/LRR-repeat protein At4g14103-like isoform X3 [Panicum virgatum]KAG2556505.1 hypothetical protein PVAP13_8NG080800 [Panicum virgatum]